MLVLGSGLIATAQASAANVGVPAIRFGFPPVEPGSGENPKTIAGQKDAYTIFLTVPSGVSSAAGDYIDVDASSLAPGTIFPAGQYPVYAISDASAGNLTYQINSPVILSNAGQTVRIPLSGSFLEAAPGHILVLTIGPLTPTMRIINPATVGTYQLTLSTNKDGPGNSPMYDVVGGTGSDAISAVSGSGQSAVVAEPFDDPLVAKYVDGNGDPVENATVTFTTPATGAGGTFTGGTNGGRTYTSTTDSNGLITTPELTANGKAGTWQATASSDAGTPADPDDDPTAVFSLTNTASGPDSIELELSPSKITANGVSSSTAKATVTDEFGNPLAGQDVSITSGQLQVGDTGYAGSGVYRATVEGSNNPGNFTITATDTTGGLISDNATLTQKRDRKGPGTSITRHPNASTTSKKVKFGFEANAADARGFKCRLDDRAFRKCSSPVKYKVGTGRHVFKVRAKDLVGNEGPVASFRFERRKKR